MITFKQLLTELIDIYSIDELESKDIEYEIQSDSRTRFRVKLKYKDQYYLLMILPLFNPKRSSINFGNTDENFGNLNLNMLINSPYSSRILASVFGLIRYWVDKHGIYEFEYGAEGDIRNKLYDYYFRKHFADFEKHFEKFGKETIIVWKKI